MTEETTSIEAPADVHALLERIEEAWRQLFAALDDIPEDRLSDPGVIGDWSLKDLFGHLAFWDEHATKEIERALAGLPREDNAWQQMNETDHAAEHTQRNITHIMTIDEHRPTRRIVQTRQQIHERRFP